MDFDTNWDMDKYRGRGETDEHWELRRHFMEEHKDRFPEDRLVCLAQVFANMEFLGCKYSLEIIKTVTELSIGIVESYREKRKNKLQRTFVKASDAAEAKQKGLKRPSNTSLTESEAPRKIPSYFTVSSASSTSTTVHSQQPTESSNTNKYQPKVSGNGSAASSNKSQRLNIGQKHSGFGNDPLQEIVLMEHGFQEDQPLNIIQRSGHACNMPPNIKYSLQAEGTKCVVEMNGHVLASCLGPSKQNARTRAINESLHKLRQICYTIKVKKQVISYSQVDKNEMDSSSNSNQESDSLGKDNLGNKMLRLMGWQGGGLGKTEQGIQEPVQVESRVSRAGLGLVPKSDKEFETRVRQIMREFKFNETGSTDLTFSSDFENSERATMHLIAQQLGLKSRSYGKGANRYLVISKKVGLWNLVEELLSRGGSDEKYELIPPGGTPEEVWL